MTDRSRSTPHAACDLPRVLAAALLLAAAACGGTEEAAPVRDVAVRDSAGIAVVENGAADPAALVTIDSAPALVIADRGDDDPNYQLFQIRGAVRLADGSVVVANGGASDLRVYGPDGAWRRTIGRKGSGPGEFQQLNWLDVLPGDTILTYDFSGGRLSLFTPDGALVRDVTLAAAGERGFVRPLGVLGGDRLLAQAGGSVFANDALSGTSRDTVTLLVVGLDGAVRDTLGQFPGSERMVSTGGSGERRSVMVSNVPFGRASAFSSQGNAVAVATAERYEIALHDGNGALRRLVRRASAPVPVTDADIAAYRERVIGGSSQLPPQFMAMMREQLDAAPRPETKPAYDAVRLDRAGRLWVREAVEAGEPARWALYDAEGALLAVLRLPDGFRLLDAGADYALGVERDADDLERLVLYPLRAVAR